MIYYIHVDLRTACIPCTPPCATSSCSRREPWWGRRRPGQYDIQSTILYTLHRIYIYSIYIIFIVFILYIFDIILYGIHILYVYYIYIVYSIYYIASKGHWRCRCWATFAGWPPASTWSPSPRRCRRRSWVGGPTRTWRRKCFIYDYFYYYYYYLYLLWKVEELSSSRSIPIFYM